MSKSIGNWLQIDLDEFSAQQVPYSLIFEDCPDSRFFRSKLKALILSPDLILKSFAPGNRSMSIYPWFRYHEHMLRDPCHEAGNLSWRWCTTKPILVSATIIGFPPNPKSTCRRSTLEDSQQVPEGSRRTSQGSWYPGSLQI